MLTLPSQILDALDPTLQRRQAISLILTAMLDWGFEHSRYYELDFHVPISVRAGFEDRAVLSQLGGNAAVPAHEPGYAIDWESTALFLEARGADVVAADVDEFVAAFPEAQPWAQELHVGGRAFVDIPVTRNGRPVGLLAADWCGPATQLSSSDRKALRTLGLALGSLRESDENDIAPLEMMSGLPKEIVESALVQIMLRINAAFGAVFEYDWRSQKLQKLFEYFSSGTGPTRVNIDEPLYAVRDGFLTGRSWGSREFRYVADLEELDQARPGWVNVDSYVGHYEIHGHSPRTVLYTVVGRSEHKYLLRFMNRVDSPELPFLPRRRQIITRLSAQLEGEIDYAIAEQRLKSLASIAALAVANLHDPDPVADRVRSALSDEGVNDFAYIAVEPRSDVPTYSFVVGASFGKQSPANLLARVRSATAPRAQTTVECEDESARPAPSAEIHFGAVGESFALVRAGTETVDGYLLIPISAVEQTSFDADLAHVQPYCDLLTSAVEAMSMYISEDGARKALGYIGHEIGTPFSVLGDAAVAVAVEGIKLADSIRPYDAAIQRELRRVSQSSYVKIQRSRDEIDRVMEIAPVLAQMGSGTLQMYFTQIDLAEVFETAADRITTETRGTQPVSAGVKVPAHSRKFTVEILESTRRLNMVQGDSGLLGQAALNLLRNAVKYSLPRHPPDPMKILVAGQNVGDRFASISVTNWGWGIPEELQGRVFMPFVRGQIDDRLKSLPGMGLGLYLVQTIVSAHSGSSYCRSHPTLDFPKDPLHGWETTFEIRIPNNLMSGPHSAEIDPYKAVKASK